MNRIRKQFAPQVTYEAIQQPAESDNEDNESEVGDAASTAPQQAPFSAYEYAVFLLLGISMLWAWYVYCEPGRTSSMRLFIVHQL